MNAGNEVNRRNLFRRMGLTGAVLLVPGARPGSRPKEERGEDEVAPAEDLMREHGVLNRVLLVYEECVRRLSGVKPDLDPRLLSEGTTIIRTFIEDYHEKLEEDHLFPRFEKAGQQIELVKILREQHRAGRALTSELLQLSSDTGLRTSDGRRRLVSTVNRFIRMYRPHEAREDTVLFPALRRVVSAHEYASLGEDFERKEHELFGKEGFEGIVEKVARIERELGIYDLQKFTPGAGAL